MPPAALRASACASRLARLAAVSSYNNCASGAPRRWSLSCFTSTTFSSQPWRICRISPAAISFETFTRCPSRWTLPPSIAALARLRVLKKRAAHSHLSRRTLRGLVSRVAHSWGSPGMISSKWCMPGKRVSIRLCRWLSGCSRVSKWAMPYCCALASTCSVSSISRVRAGSNGCRACRRCQNVLLFLRGVQVVGDHHAIEPVGDVYVIHLDVQRLAMGVGDHDHVPMAVVQSGEKLDGEGPDADHVLQFPLQGRDIHIQSLRPVVQAVPLQACPARR